MKAVRVRDLKDNPTRALRSARREPVVVLNRDEPEAVILSLRDLRGDEADVRLALARVLYEHGGLSLGRAARVGGLSLEAFMEYLGARGIPVLRLRPDELEGDLVALRAWRGRASSSTARG